VDGLKIDRSVLARLDSGSEPLVRAILEAARSIGIPVVAEGMETDAQWSRMRGLQCELAQGFRFSPPVDADAAVSLLPRARGPAWSAPQAPGAVKKR
jgi:EAL domain-containing protein (putative c-di-GMP-specific phosphodiesterase class I)